MAKIMNARTTATTAKWAQVSLPRCLAKPLPSHLIPKGPSSLPNEKARTDHLRKELVADAHISLKGLHCRRMKRNQSGFISFRAADRHQRFGKINILAVQS
jgi:hypothetical protein